MNTFIQERLDYASRYHYQIAYFNFASQSCKYTACSGAQLCL